MDLARAARPAAGGYIEAQFPCVNEGNAGD
jgi:hypothetical protein